MECNADHAGTTMSDLHRSRILIIDDEAASGLKPSWRSSSLPSPASAAAQT